MSLKHTGQAIKMGIEYSIDRCRPVSQRNSRCHSKSPAWSLHANQNLTITAALSRVQFHLEAPGQHPWADYQQKFYGWSTNLRINTTFPRSALHFSAWALNTNQNSTIMAH